MITNEGSARGTERRARKRRAMNAGDESSGSAERLPEHERTAESEQPGGRLRPSSADDTGA